jgi:hypothetical protein
MNLQGIKNGLFVIPYYRIYYTLNIVLIKEFIAVLILLFYRLQQVRSRCRGHAVPAACAA